MSYLILSSETVGINYKTKVCDLLMSIMQNGYHLESSMNEFQLAKAKQQIKVMEKKFKLLCVKDLSIPVIASGLYGTSAKKLYDSLIDLGWLSTDKYGNKKVENKKYLQMMENNRLLFTPEGFNKYRLKFPTLKYELAGII